MSTVPPSERPGRTYGGNPGPAGWQESAAPPGYAQPPPPPGAWAQPPPGYADPNGPPVEYQQTAGWADSRRGYRAPRARRAGPSLLTVAPGLVASLIISAAVLVLFLGNLFVALGAVRGTSGRLRLLQFLAPADLATATALALAVALVVLQRLLPGESAAVVGPRGGRVRTIALVAGAVAAWVAVAALIRGIVYLTIPHQPAAVGLGFFIIHLAPVAVAGIAAWWALRTRW